jgi:hypothetical protein
MDFITKSENRLAKVNTTLEKLFAGHDEELEQAKELVRDYWRHQRVEAIVVGAVAPVPDNLFWRAVFGNDGGDSLSGDELAKVYSTDPDFADVADPFAVWLQKTQTDTAAMDLDVDIFAIQMN